MGVFHEVGVEVAGEALGQIILGRPSFFRMVLEMAELRQQGAISF
jgi:hypothetical protein